MAGIRKTQSFLAGSAGLVKRYYLMSTNLSVAT